MEFQITAIDKRMTGVLEAWSVSVFWVSDLEMVRRMLYRNRCWRKWVSFIQLRTWIRGGDRSLNDLMLSVFILSWLFVSADLASVQSSWMLSNMGWMLEWI